MKEKTVIEIMRMEQGSWIGLNNDQGIGYALPVKLESSAEFEAERATLKQVVRDRLGNHIFDLGKPVCIQIVKNESEILRSHYYWMDEQNGINEETRADSRQEHKRGLQNSDKIITMSNHSTIGTGFNQPYTALEIKNLLGFDDEKMVGFMAYCLADRMTKAELLDKAIEYVKQGEPAGTCV